MTFDDLAGGGIDRCRILRRGVGPHTWSGSGRPVQPVSELGEVLVEAFGDADEVEGVETVGAVEEDLGEAARLMSASLNAMWWGSPLGSIASQKSYQLRIRSIGSRIHITSAALRPELQNWRGRKWPCTQR